MMAKRPLPLLLWSSCCWLSLALLPLLDPHASLTSAQTYVPGWNGASLEDLAGDGGSDQIDTARSFPPPLPPSDGLIPSHSQYNRHAILTARGILWLR
jgi:hypothetical protein